MSAKVQNINAGKGGAKSSGGKKANAFASLVKIEGENAIIDLMAEGDKFARVPLSRIRIKSQVRKEFSREESTMDEMAASIKKNGVIQPILLRPVHDDPDYDYELVAGERRYRGSEIAGLTDIPALIREMTDEQAAEYQMVENIHRLNLSMLEEASRVKQDLADLGSVEAVCEKYNKKAPWVSKIIGMLSLPPEAERLITEGITNDVEVIGAVKQIAKKDPALAKETVDKLAETRGKKDARSIANNAKSSVKQPNEKKGQKAANAGTVATPKDKTHELPGVETVTNFAEANKANQGGEQHSEKRPTVFTPTESLGNAYTLIFESGSSPKMVLDMMEESEREAVKGWLNDFYDAGTQAKNASRLVMENLRKGLFATDGYGAFAMIAFLQGADANVKAFSAINILADAKG